VVLLLRWRLGGGMSPGSRSRLCRGAAGVLFRDRDRPPASPSGGTAGRGAADFEFPSGHTATAVALYGCIAILVFWIYSRRPATRVAVVVLCCIPVVVGMSRLYRGMHYPSDVLAGALTGGLWLLLVITTLLPRQGAMKRGDDHPALR
jgi:membrane-associated phospholipid phosphatase